MAVRHCLIPLALLASATAAALSCGDPSPVGVQTPALRAARASNKPQPTGTSNKTGLVACSQTYDSVTKVIGPGGDTLQVGHHILWVDTQVLSAPVTITAVAPADTVRWVRFQPDGLVFPPSSADLANGLSAGAILYTSYKDCGLPTSDTLRVAQVSDALAILGYLQTWSQVRRNAWSQANQWVAGVLPHFSNYAVAW